MANPEGMYFVSFAVVNWMGVFIREEYMSIVVEGDYAGIKGQIGLCVM